jgi:hypothetical protein
MSSGDTKDRLNSAKSTFGKVKAWRIKTHLDSVPASNLELVVP